MTFEIHIKTFIFTPRKLVRCFVILNNYFIDNKYIYNIKISFQKINKCASFEPFLKIDVGSDI